MRYVEEFLVKLLGAAAFVACLYCVADFHAGIQARRFKDEGIGVVVTR